jgi:hypothetical protein
MARMEGEKGGRERRARKEGEKGETESRLAQIPQEAEASTDVRLKSQPLINSSDSRGERGPGVRGRGELPSLEEAVLRPRLGPGGAESGCTEN